MKILITGGGGFLGSWTVALLRLNHEIIVLSRPESKLNRIASLDDVQFVREPIHLWPEVINSHKPDVCIFFHWDGVLGADRNSLLQMENVSEFEKLLDGINVPTRIIGVGSQAELGTCSGEITESQEDGALTTYGTAKILARKALINNPKFRDRSTWARIFSTYGNLDNESWFIPSAINSLSQNRNFPMTQGEQLWSYLHAFDVARAFQLIVEVKPISNIVNIGNPFPVRLSEVANQIMKAVDSKAVIEIGKVPYRQDEVMFMKPICETLVSIGWKPLIELDFGLAVIAEEAQGKRFDLSQFINENLT